MIVRPWSARVCLVRLGAVAACAIGVGLLAGTRPVAGLAASSSATAQATPPPGTVVTAIAVTPATALPGATVEVTGSGFVPASAVGATVCPIDGCLPGQGAVPCQPDTASAAGSIDCKLALGLSFAPGDVVVTIRQTAPYATNAEGAVCPSPVPSAVATVPPLPASPPAPPTTVPSSVPLPASAPPAPGPVPVTVPNSVPVPSPPQSGQTLSACARQASAIVTVLPRTGATPVPRPETLQVVEPPAEPPNLSIPAIGGPSLPSPQQSAPPAPRRPSTSPRGTVWAAPTGVPLPLRDVAPALLCLVAGLLTFAASLVPPRTRL